jgi:hypothetical protein
MEHLLLELPTTTFASRPASCLADSLVNSLYLLTYPVKNLFDESKPFLQKSETGPLDGKALLRG